jgi:hypothetical protein
MITCARAYAASRAASASGWNSQGHDAIVRASAAQGLPQAMDGTTCSRR